MSMQYKAKPIYFDYYLVISDYLKRDRDIMAVKDGQKLTGKDIHDLCDKNACEKCHHTRDVKVPTPEYCKAYTNFASSEFDISVVIQDGAITGCEIVNHPKVAISDLKKESIPKKLVLH